MQQAYTMLSAWVNIIEEWRVHIMCYLCTIWVILLRRHPLSKSAVHVNRRSLLHNQRLKMRDVSISAELCPRWLINHATRLLGENAKHTKSKLPEPPVIFVSAPLLHVLGCSPLYADMPWGEISTVRPHWPPLHFLALLPPCPFMVPTKNEPPCFVPFPFLSPSLIGFCFCLF